MIIDSWRELLTGQKTRHSIWLRQHQHIDHDEKTGEKSVKHDLSGRSKFRQGTEMLAVTPGRFPAIMVDEWCDPEYSGALMAMPYCQVRNVYAGGRWYQQLRSEIKPQEYDLKPGWFDDDFVDSKGGNLSPEQLIRNGFRRVAVTIKDLHEADVRQMSEYQLRREGYESLLSFAQVWCSRSDRKVSRILANIASRDGIPASERERLTRHYLSSRPDEFYRCVVLEISL